VSAVGKQKKIAAMGAVWYAFVRMSEDFFVFLLLEKA